MNLFPARACLLLSALYLAAWTQAAVAQEGKMVSLSEAGANALKQSQLTLPGSPAFHLKARITNSADPSSPYAAEIEEYWLSPQNWRRKIESSGFSQTLIVEGSKISEQDTGDYYPLWLRNLVTAIFDPLPMHEQLDLFKGNVEVPAEADDLACLNFAVPSGVPPVRASLPYAFCFQGTRALLQQVLTPGYKARFEDYKPFNGRMVPRRIKADLGAGAVLMATITALDNNLPSDRSLFTVSQPTLPGSQLRSMQIDESIARKITVAAPDIAWPAVREGKTSGTLSVYVSVDRLGHVREVWPLASDNSELNSIARDQLMHWQFQPYVNGGPMQMECVLTFAFTAMMGEPIPLLSNDAARRLATHVVEPHFAPGEANRGTRFSLRVRVDEHGRIASIKNISNAAAPLESAGEQALHQWRFRPYLRDDKPDKFDADITFTVR